MPINKTEAIVIGYYPLREADRIVLFFTKEYGIIRAVAKGAMKINSKLCGRLELLNYGLLVFYRKENRELQIVSSFDVIDAFQSLREDLKKIAYCSYLAELVQKVIPEYEASSDIFNLMLNIMQVMRTYSDPELLVRTFEIRLLDTLGLSPQLDLCTNCSNPIDSNEVIFNVPSGGVLCSNCHNPEHSCIKVSLGSIEVLKKMRSLPIGLVTRLRLSDRNRKELNAMISNFISFHIDVKGFKSLNFIRSLEDEV